MVRVVRVVRLVGGEGDSRVRVEQLHHLALVEDVAAEEHPLAAHLARRVRHHLIEQKEEEMRGQKRGMRGRTRGMRGRVCEV